MKAYRLRFATVSVLLVVLGADVRPVRAQEVCSRRIAYTVSHLIGKSYSPSDLYILDTEAGSPRQERFDRYITAGLVGGGVWSPDGSRMAVLSDGEEDMPNLEKYQVILFSDRLVTPLGPANQWLDYDANSADRASEALRKIKPAGNTNMYAALDAAFRFRPQGLDTVYLFSDGLPNLGEGLTADQQRTMTETQRTQHLSQVVRNALKNTWNRGDAGRPKVRINTIGFFYESPEVGAFLWALARENDGSFVGMSRP